MIFVPEESNVTSWVNVLDFSRALLVIVSQLTSGLTCDNRLKVTYFQQLQFNLTYRSLDHLEIHYIMTTFYTRVYSVMGRIIDEE